MAGPAFRPGSLLHHYLGRDLGDLQCPELWSSGHRRPPRQVAAEASQRGRAASMPLPLTVRQLLRQDTSLERAPRLRAVGTGYLQPGS